MSLKEERCYDDVRCSLRNFHDTLPCFCLVLSKTCSNFVGDTQIANNYGKYIRADKARET